MEMNIGKDGFGMNFGMVVRISVWEQFPRLSGLQ